MKALPRHMLLAATAILAIGAAPTRAIAAEPVLPELKIDIAAQPVGDALNEFARQSGLQVVIDPKEGAGIRASGVTGKLTPQAALSRLLAGTGLRYEFLNERTVAVRSPAAKGRGVDGMSSAPSQETAEGALALQPTLQRVAQAPKPEPSSAPGAAADEKEPGEVVEVTGSRIRSMVGEEGINPVLVYTRKDIERSGMSSLADFTRLIPQMAVGNVTSFDGSSSGSTPEGRLIVNLRGITGANTLVLVDGRRIAKTGQRGVAEAYEMTGLPLSAVERVEVLLDGGSAIYGSDAVGGVINIITRKDYTGSEAEYSIDNTFDSDAAFKHYGLSTGLRSGRLSVRASAAYEEQNAMARRDRWWLASDDRRFLGGSDTRSSIPVGGQVSAVPVSQGGSGTLPGTGGATVLKIPVNSNGRTLTIADFVAAGAPTDADRYDSGKVLNARNEFFRINGSASAEYTWRDWMSFNATGTFSRVRSYGYSGPLSLTTSAASSNPAFRTVLPANYPGNPFGVPINVSKFLWELPELNRRYQYDSYSARLGVRGALAANWRYDSGVDWTGAKPVNLDPTFQILTTSLAPAIQSANPPLLLNDSLNYGAANPAGTFEALFYSGTDAERPETLVYDFKADGPVYEWWGGEISLAVGGEVRRESITFARETAPASTESAQPEEDRVVKAAYAEALLPVVSPRNGIPLVHSFNLSGALRYDSYNDFGEVSKPRMGFSYKPFRWLMLRASRGDAFKVPSLVDLTRPTNRQNQNFGTTGSFQLFDTERNEQLLGSVTNITGGNPNLLPENSRNESWGVVFDVPFAALEGLSFSVNYSDIRILNRVGSVSYQERLAFRPDMFTRADPTPADILAGIPGRITAIDNRSINISLFNSAAYDFQARYRRSFGELGDFDFSANVTKQDKYEAIANPNLAPTANTAPILRPTRGVGTINWYRRGLDLGLAATWQDSYRITATNVNSTMPSTLLWDLRTGYNFDNGDVSMQGRFGRWLQGTRVNLSIINLFDEEPSFAANSQVSGAIDPRLRRYVLTVRKEF